MAESILNQPQFQDEEKAREYLEALRWPNGPVCPHCGSVGKHYSLTGKSHRKGLWKCVDCRDQFTVTVGTVFERSKVKLNLWLQAVHLVCASKNGMSSMELHRLLGVTQKTAWFMLHRIREAMKPEGLKVSSVMLICPISPTSKFLGSRALRGEESSLVCVPTARIFPVGE